LSSVRKADLGVFVDQMRPAGLKSQILTITRSESRHRSSIDPEPLTVPDILGGGVALGMA
jgi:hypothetical protein